MIGSENKGYLILEDKSIFYGFLYGTSPPKIGEVVFNTSMTGYQEVLFDPSYWGQIVVMTAVHIGNTGINSTDEESKMAYLSGFVAKSFENPSNWRSETSLINFMNKSNLTGIYGLDTRALTIHLRTKGSLKGGIFDIKIPVEKALEQVNMHPNMAGTDGASKVSCKKPYLWTKSTEEDWITTLTKKNSAKNKNRLKVAVYDFGVKFNILRRLIDCGFEVKVFPSNTPPSKIFDYKPNGILLSNGPGDPAAVTGAVKNIQSLLGKIPIFGICLGHQLLALANNGKTHKMKFGHRGINHPVAKDKSGRVIVSVHNHGFAVSDNPLPKGATVTLKSLNDNTIEGLDYPEINSFSVQFHPEASAGPHDAEDLFLEFKSRILNHARKK